MLRARRRELAAHAAEPRRITAVHQAHGARRAAARLALGRRERGEAAAAGEQRGERLKQHRLSADLRSNLFPKVGAVLLNRRCNMTTIYSWQRLRPNFTWQSHLVRCNTLLQVQRRQPAAAVNVSLQVGQQQLSEQLGAARVGGQHLGQARVQRRAHGRLLRQRPGAREAGDGDGRVSLVALRSSGRQSATG